MTGRVSQLAVCAACVESAPWRDNEFTLPVMGIVTRPVRGVKRRWVVGQASCHVPLLKVSPSARSRRRLSAATRWWSQALFFLMPR